MALKALIDFNFVFNLLVFGSLLKLLKIVSDQLQSKTLEMTHANDLVCTVIDNIHEMRNGEMCNELLNEAKYICEQHNIPLKSTTEVVSGKR